MAAVAYGTETVRKVDAITGPGNNFTQMAKKLLFGEVKIDSIAGPSEIAIITDEYANPTFVAADMMSQAEHGTGFEASTTFHILPTCGTAKFSSGMSVQEFMRGYSVIKYPESALKTNADYIIQLAESEGMKAHALAVKVRK